MIIDFKIFISGYCKQLERLAVSNGRFKNIIFPGTWFYLKHEKEGGILFDTGYSTKFYEIAKKFPEKLYEIATPVFIKKNGTAKKILKKNSIDPNSIKYVVISHFHADHIGGLNDFPNAKFIYLKSAYDHLKNKNRLAKTLNGFLQDLIPDNFNDNSIFLEDSKKCNTEFLNEFSNCYDIFGDSSIIAVNLSGHAKDQIGIYFSFNKNEYFLISDACWNHRTFKDLKFPSKLVNFLFYDLKEYRSNNIKLHKLYRNRDINIIPSHCMKTVSEQINRLKSENR